MCVVWLVGFRRGGRVDVCRSGVALVAGGTRRVGVVVVYRRGRVVVLLIRWRW